MSGETCDWPGCSAPSLWRSHHQAWLCEEHDTATTRKYRWGAAFTDEELGFLDEAIAYWASVSSRPSGRPLESEVTAEMDRRGLLDDVEREVRAELIEHRQQRRAQGPVVTYPAGDQPIATAAAQSIGACGAVHPSEDRMCLLPLGHGGPHGWEHDEPAR